MLCIHNYSIYTKTILKKTFRNMSVLQLNVHHTRHNQPHGICHINIVVYVGTFDLINGKASYKI